MKCVLECNCGANRRVSANPCFPVEAVFQAVCLGPYPSWNWEGQREMERAGESLFVSTCTHAWAYHLQRTTLSSYKCQVMFVTPREIADGVHTLNRSEGCMLLGTPFVLLCSACRTPPTSYADTRPRRIVCARLARRANTVATPLLYAQNGL